jgi:hypothetical protein
MARPLNRRAHAALAAASLVLLLAACERAAPAPPADSAAPPPPVVRVDSAPTAPAVGEIAWDDASAGPALFVPGDSARPSAAAAVLPDSTTFAADSAVGAATAALDGVAVDLFAPSGQVGTAQIAASARDAFGDECAVGPTVRLTGRATPSSWTVAFATGRAAPIRIDSIVGLAAADSAARAAEVARLASLVPRTNSGEFAGLPFSVRQAHRFTESGVDVVVAEVVRKVAQEANPREQHVLLVGERPAGSKARYELAYHETSAGDETNVETRDVLAAVRLGASRRPTIVLNREFAEGLAYSLIERTGPRRWRVRWTSGTVGCAEEAG